MILYILFGKPITTVQKIGIAFVVFALALVALLPIADGVTNSSSIFEILIASAILGTVKK